MKSVSNSELDEIARCLSRINDSDDEPAIVAQLLYASFGLTIDQAYGLMQDRPRNPPES